MTLTDFFALFVFPHVAAGTAALGLFWISALMRKGTAVHRRIGQAYLLAMAVILITSLPLVGLTWLRGHAITAVFLAYLTLLIASSCRNTLAAIRFRQSPQRYFGLDLKILAVAVAVAGASVMLLGLSRNAWILIGFGGIGPILLIQTIKRTRALKQGERPEANWWLKEHAGAMIANGAATHIAFFQIGLTRLFPNLDVGVVQNLAWFGPLIIAGIAGLWLNRRFNSSASAVQSAETREAGHQPLRAS